MVLLLIFAFLSLIFGRFQDLSAVDGVMVQCRNPVTLLREQSQVDRQVQSSAPSLECHYKGSWTRLGPL